MPGLLLHSNWFKSSEFEIFTGRPIQIKAVTFCSTQKIDQQEIDD